MNQSLTYFAVYFGDNFNLQDFCDLLNLQIENVAYYKSDMRLEIGRNSQFKINLNEMVRKTLSLLLGKEDALYMLRKKYNLKYYLARVAWVNANEVNPILSLEPDIVEFLYLTGTEDDLDYYVG